MRTTLFAIALAATVAGTATAAHAGPVACTVLEVEASSADAPSVDAELKAIERKLKKPPFASWNVFKRLGASNLSLEPQQVGEATLVHGKAGLLLREVSARAGKKPRVSLGITLDDAGGKRVIDTKIQVDGGDYFVLARPLPANKGHIVALTCRP